MLIEAVEIPILYQWPNGEISLEPGRPIQVDPDRGRKILKKCGGKVRIVEPATIGTVIEFRSPLFGLCTGRVLSLEVESIRITGHSVIKETMTIPQFWITRMMEGDP